MLILFYYQKKAWGHEEEVEQEVITITSSPASSQTIYTLQAPNVY